MVNMFKGMNVETGTDLEGLIKAAQWLERSMERLLDGMLMKAGII
jgi:hydroxymethylglutaryl-CoA lyase